MIRKALFIACIAISAPALAADPITGRWVTQGGEGVVAIERCGGAICGKLARIVKPTPGAPTTDVNNPDEALRNRPLLGTTILSGFIDGGKEWRGTIYDPKSGRSYRSTVRASGDKLAVKGCIAVFCRTQEWTRLR
ncbi:DUF2147 domain-containing protein [Sphingomonas sp. S1-29]|uniref:DUF2147 domain-containing protein n=1 Tax=Sphingomonas qomolangmaensis TaxID=2918765 RepID=A0ABY5LA52_9SPHN|nr:MULTISPECIES: DUF2147 domain-containing protein [Sphingomonas]UUL82680.1 DUF2147 domain-containing protein [Sphingomonas qomolangmaensis]UZK69158.1 DUF2147 domain-containing protein [Sphingomonas sp. S1-29]